MRRCEGNFWCVFCTFQKTPFKEKKMERKHGAIAQWLERSPSKREVEGSIPSSALFFVRCSISGSLLGHKQPVHMLSTITQYWIRPYSGEYTSSRLIWEVKHQQAWIVLAWVTSWEVRVLESFLLFFYWSRKLFWIAHTGSKRRKCREYVLFGCSWMHYEVGRFDWSIRSALIKVAKMTVFTCYSATAQLVKNAKTLGKRVVWMLLKPLWGRNRKLEHHTCPNHLLPVKHSTHGIFRFSTGYSAIAKSSKMWKCWDNGSFGCSWIHYEVVTAN